MKTAILLLTLGLSLLLVGCASGTKNEAGEPSTDEGTTAPALGPGSARVSATVIGYQEVQNAFLCTLNIQQVHRYGASTPPLPVGTEIEVLMHKRLFGEDPDGTNAAAHLQAGKAMEVTLSHQQCG